MAAFAIDFVANASARMVCVEAHCFHGMSTSNNHGFVVRCLRLGNWAAHSAKLGHHGHRLLLVLTIRHRRGYVFLFKIMTFLSWSEIVQYSADAIVTFLHSGSSIVCGSPT